MVGFVDFVVDFGWVVVVGGGFFFVDWGGFRVGVGLRGGCGVGFGGLRGLWVVVVVGFVVDGGFFFY